jgi:PTS system nitrogen regulatory IIA component
MDNKLKLKTNYDDILTLEEVSQYLKLSQKTVLRMVHGGKIPCAKVGGQWRFIRALIDDWLLAKMKVVPKNDLVRLIEADADAVVLSRLLRPELIELKIQPGSKNEVLAQLVRPLVAAGIVKDEQIFLRKLLHREQMASTAVGKSVAIPHIRNPRENPEGGPALCIGICQEGTDFHAVDGKKTHIFFLLYTDSEVVHLRVLGRISRLLRNEQTVSALVSARKKEHVVRIILQGENSFSLTKE